MKATDHWRLLPAAGGHSIIGTEEWVRKQKGVVQRLYRAADGREEWRAEP